MPPPARFSVKISMDERSGHLLLNGFPIFRNYEGHRNDLEMPVTEYILAGVNTLAWELIAEAEPQLPREARVSASLRAAPWAGEGAPVDLFSVSHAGPVPEAPRVGTDAAASPFGPVSPTQTRWDRETELATVSRQISLTLAMPAWAWSRSPPIADSPATTASLTEYYRHIFDLLRRGDANSLETLHREKAAELAEAYGRTSAEMMGEIGLPGMPREPEWSLRTPDWDGLWNDVVAEGRLVRLVHPEAGRLFVFRDDAGLYRSFDFWVRRDGQNWVISR